MEFDLGKAIRRAGLTQKAVADRIGVNKSYISEMVAGKKKPSFEVLVNLMEALDAAPNDMFGTDATAATGFSEPAVAPFVERQPNQAQAMLALAGITRDRANHTALHELTRDMPGLLLLKGDVLVVDLRPKPKSGQIVVVQARDPDLDEYVTELGLMHGHRPAPVYGNSNTLEGARIMGAVVASVRLWAN